jgi:hypothetical protein
MYTGIRSIGLSRNYILGKVWPIESSNGTGHSLIDARLVLPGEQRLKHRAVRIYRTAYRLRRSY